MLDAIPDGVWLVELAALTEPGLVPQAVVDSLGLKENPGKALRETLLEYLAEKRLLLVLDNCEHLLAACSELAERVLRQCPRVTVFATSREALGISGELTFRIPSLALPDTNVPQTPESLTHYEAVRLFVERAQFHQPAFCVTNENAPALASVCLRLDGIPLAIELAAARIRSLTVEEVNQRLDQRFRLLTTGSRTALPRQQTLQSLIDWSYDLLDEPHQSLLSRLSVFSGGWTLDDAEAVCSDELVPECDVLDILSSLVDKSLVTPEERTGATRYRLLETVREYAKAKLLKAGDHEGWHDRHLMHCRNLATRPSSLHGAERNSWLVLVENEIDNMRAALDWSLRESSGNREEGDFSRRCSSLELCTHLSHFWYHRCHFREGLDWCVKALAQSASDAPTEARAKLLYEAGSLAFFRDAKVAETMFLESCALSRQLGCKGLEGWSLIYVADLNSLRGDVAKAMEFYRDALALLRESKERLGEAYCLKDMALTARREHNLALARSLIEEAVSIARQLGDEPAEANCLHILGNIALYQKDYAEARGWLDESLELARKHGMLSNRPNIFWNLGMVCLESGALGEAGDFLRQCLKLGREQDNYVPVLEAMMSLARLASIQSNPERAARLYGAFAVHQEAAKFSIDPCDIEAFEQNTSDVRERLGSGQYDKARQKGAAMSMEDAIKFGLLPDR